MAKPKKRPATPPKRPMFPSEPELVVMVRPDVDLRATAEGLRSAAGADVSSLQQLVEAEGARLRPLFARARSGSSGRPPWLPAQPRPTSRRSTESRWPTRRPSG